MENNGLNVFIKELKLYDKVWFVTYLCNSHVVQDIVLHSIAL